MVQLIGSGTDSIQDGQCTIHTYEVVNHPTRETIDGVHETIDPYHTIVVHRHRGVGPEYNYLSSIVWSPADDAEYTLYRDGDWQNPPWMAASPRSGQTRSIESLMGELTEELLLPDLSRHGSVDLEAEGIDLETVERILGQRAAYEPNVTDDGLARPVRTDETQMPNDNQTGSMTTEDSEYENRDGSTDESAERPPELIDTTRGDFAGLDPRIKEAMATGELTAEDVVEALETVEKSEQISGEESESVTATGESEVVDDESVEKDDETSGSDGSSASEPEGASEEGSASPTSESDSGSDSADDAKGNANQAAGAEASTETSARQEQVPRDGGPEDRTFEVAIPRLTAALVEYYVERSEYDSEERLLSDAIESFIRAVLDGSIEPPNEPPTTLTVEGSTTILRSLDVVVENDDTVRDRDELVTRASPRRSD